jgi:sugar/nucleoside kinase (ribokinase family)
MKKDIQVTGLGNALVDLQYEVSEHELADLEFEKGMMTLVDIAKQKQVMAKFQDRMHHRCSGGSAANTIIAFAAFGGSAAYKTHLGSDLLGDYYFKEFQDLGIHLHAERVDSDPTGTCFVMITPDSERTMVTHLGATALHTKEHIDEDIIKRSEWLYVEGYKFSEHGSTEAVHHSVALCKEYNTKIALTFSDKFIIDVFRERLDFAVKNSDLIFCNDVEACAYTGLHSAKDAFDKLCQTVPNVCVTLGKDGSLVGWDGKVYEIPPYKVNLTDTTGAGDMYAAGFLYGIIDTRNAEIAGHLASYSASLIVSQLGARLDRNHKSMRDKIYEAHKFGRLNK